MGLFNTVNFTCPGCGERLENQTKSGSCELSSFDQDRVPYDEVQGLDPKMYCQACDASYAVDPVPEHFVSLTLRKL